MNQIIQMNWYLGLFVEVRLGISSLGRKKTYILLYGKMWRRNTIFEDTDSKVTVYYIFLILGSGVVDYLTGRSHKPL